MQDCCSAPGLMPLDQALENMLAALSPIEDIEHVSINDCTNRVLAADVLSPVNVPPNHNSAMDGYAFNFISLQQSNSLSLVGRAMAGEPFQGQCGQGQCVRIMTGAMLPSDCDTVVMQENCQVNDNEITVPKETKQGRQCAVSRRRYQMR